jgi:hypothetical protein
LSTELYIWKWVSTIILALLLWRPVKKFILSQKINKAERKEKRQLTEEERALIEKKSIPWTAFIVVTFALLFNNILFAQFYISK